MYDPVTLDQLRALVAVVEEAAINRSDWGLKWNQVLEAGGVLVSDKVEIEVEAQVVQVAG